MLTRVKNTFQEYPSKFWVLVSAAFVDTIGRTLIMPFFALYITQRFDVGMTEAGVLLAIFAITGLCGSMLGGALTDRFGRRGMAIFGLVFSALSSLLMGAINDFFLFYPLAVIVGLLSNIGGPARQAMVADLLPEEQRAEGFGVLRVTANLAWVIGPTIGGFLAEHSYLLLFVLDAVASLITAAVVYKWIPETRPEAEEDAPQQSILQTFAGYRVVAKDKIYVAFLILSTLVLIAYRQSYSTLSVYLRDVHNLPSQAYGLLMSLNAGTVVLLQFWVTRKTKKYAPMPMMALGSAFYLVGLMMYGFVSTYALFILAMMLITIGEMVAIPVGQALVARFAPEDMRGRYMAFYALSWTISSALAPWSAGLVMDNINPNWVWYAAGILCAITILGFYALHLKMEPHTAAETGERKQALVTP
jgi:MFS family permease